MLPFLDVTRLKEVEARLQEAVQARDDFLSIASHELKTPLTALKLLLGSLRRSLPRPSEALERAEKADRSAARLELLIDQLLDVSRLSAGKFRLDREPGDLAAIVREAVVQFQESAAADIRLDLDGPLPGSWDRLRMEQVMTNLLGNAVKYGRGLPVEVSARLERGVARLVVRDQGIGIEPEKQGRLDQRLERAVSARRFGGFGLGLWIVRQVVEAHGGSIALQSEVDRGTTVTIELPAGAAPG